MSPVAASGSAGARKPSPHSAWAHLQRIVGHHAPRQLKRAHAYRVKARQVRYKRRRLG